jgi:hypothetical protein
MRQLFGIADLSASTAPASFFAGGADHASLLPIAGRGMKNAAAVSLLRC